MNFNFDFESQRECFLLNIGNHELVELKDDYLIALETEVLPGVDLQFNLI